MHFQGKQNFLDTGNGSVTTPAKGKNLGVSHVLNLVVNQYLREAVATCKNCNQSDRRCNQSKYVDIWEIFSRFRRIWSSSGRVPSSSVWTFFLGVFLEVRITLKIIIEKVLFLGILERLMLERWVEFLESGLADNWCSIIGTSRKSSKKKVQTL